MRHFIGPDHYIDPHNYLTAPKHIALRIYRFPMVLLANFGVVKMPYS